jgi:integrase/recombinase XerD
MTGNRKPGDQFWQHVRNYLTVNLPRIRGLSPRTADSYRQSIAMYCSFLKEKGGTEFSKVSFEHVTRDSVIKFIRWLRDERKCGASTCNLRLSSLKSLLKYCADADLSLYAVYQEVKKVPLMKAPKMPVEHMSDAAFKALLAQPDIRTVKGLRNRMIIMLLYDTGTRVQELVDITVGDLHLEAPNPFITVTGKGSKTRSIPLMGKTISHLKEYLRRFHTDSVDGTNGPLFYSTQSGIPHMLSTDAVSVMLKNYGEAAKRTCPEAPQRVHPHLIRHYSALRTIAE